MANKPLKTIKFPGLDDTYTVPQVDAALATSGAAADAKKVGDELTNLKQDLNTINDVEWKKITLTWAHGGIDNATGANNNNGSTSRSRTDVYMKESDLFCIKNASSVVGYVIFYTKSDDTYTFVKNKPLNPNSAVDFNPSGNYYVRFDLRGGFSSTEGVSLYAKQTKYKTVMDNVPAIEALIADKCKLTKVTPSIGYANSVIGKSGTTVTTDYQDDYSVSEAIAVGDADAVLIPYDFPVYGYYIGFYTSSSISSAIATKQGICYAGTIVPIPTDAEYFRICAPEAVELACYKVNYTDSSLSLEGKAADAKAVGDALDLITGQRNNYKTTASDYMPNAKQALKKNVVVNYFATFSAFTSLMIGFTKTDTYSSGYTDYFEITATDFVMHRSGQEDVTWQHDLTIADYIGISISFDKSQRFLLKMKTNSGTYDKENNLILGSSYYPFAVLNGTGVDNEKLSMTCNDFRKDILMFGDSYFSYSASRWMYYLDSDTIDNLCINGYSGESSASAVSDFDTLIDLASPKFVVWCLGMNDGSDTDDNTPNSTWLTNVQHVISACIARGIIPILATIPSVPTINNRAKSAWVRSSGYAYIDFAKAVNSDTSGNWYSGMLHSDGVHPTAEGAKALCSRALVDFPQLLVVSN